MSLLSEAIIRVADDGVKEARVPCGTCRACCHHQTIVLSKDEDPAAYDCDPGTPILKRRADGACIYLDDAVGCTVYARRPMLCRVFHCGLWYLGTAQEKRAEMAGFGVEGERMVASARQQAAGLLALGEVAREFSAAGPESRE
jgi:hypothetical protein